MNKIFNIILTTFALTFSTRAMEDHFSVLAKMKILGLPFFDVWHAVEMQGKDKSDALKKLDLSPEFNKDFAIKELIDSIDCTYKNGRKYICAHNQLIKFLKENHLSNDLLKTANANYKCRRFDIIGKLSFAQLANRTFYDCWLKTNNSKTKEQLLVYLIDKINQKLHNKEIDQTDYEHLKIELKILLVETKGVTDTVIAQIQTIIANLN